METLDAPEPAMRDLAGIWRAADKIVYSSTLSEPRTGSLRYPAGSPTDPSAR